MKKKILTINLINISLAIIFFLICIIAIVAVDKQKNNDKDIRDYLNFSTNLFDGNNALELSDKLKAINKKITVSVIDLEGNPVINATNENYLDLPEILKLGTIHTRLDQTTKKNITYIASLDNGYYVRIGLAFSSSSSIYFKFLLVAVISFVLIYFVSVLITRRVVKKGLQPLNQVVKRLNIIVDNEVSNEFEDIDMISSQIDELNKVINQKIEDLKEEKEKVDFVLNNMNRGLVVIDSSCSVVLINQFAKLIFKYADNVLNKHYIYLIRHIEIQKAIQDTIHNKASSINEIKIDKSIYNISIYPLNNKWTLKDQTKNGVVLIIREVTEIKNMEKMKREFFQNASHELKSPLTTIIGYQQMIKEGIISTTDELNDATNRTIKEAQRMNKIIGEMLELSKLESNIEVVSEVLDVTEIVKEVIDSKKGLIEEKKLVLNLELNKLFVKMNSSHLYQLVNNLVDNAIKYNVSDGLLGVTVKDNELIIKDSGIGIDPQHQNRIFERFYRVDKGRTKEIGGTGLGLSIVKHICNIYDAKITLESKVSKGSTFKVTFKQY